MVLALRALFSACSLLLLWTAEFNSNLPLTFVVSIFAAAQFGALTHVFVDHFIMDDAHRDEGALSRIPVWDGDPTRWEVF